MADTDSDIPEKFRGEQDIIIAELDGSPIVMPASINAAAQSKKGPVNLSELPPIARINGVSEEAVDRIADIVVNWHRETGIPIMPITRASVLQALLSEDN